MKHKIETEKENKDLKHQRKDIIYKLYKFRFLNRVHVQRMLNQKHFKQVIRLLNDLTKKGYINREFTRKFGGVPAVYSLSKKSITTIRDWEGIRPELLNRLYREDERTEIFKKHCQFVADIHLSLITFAKAHKSTLHYYGKSDIEGMQHLIVPEPDIYFVLEENKDNIKRYFLDVFDEQIPKEGLYKRAKQYFDYYQDAKWQDNTKKPFPEIILVCPNSRAKNQMRGIVTTMLKRETDEVVIHLSTWEEIKRHGIKKEVLHKVEVQ